MDDFAGDLIEYAQRYGDYKLEGHGYLLSGPYEDIEVEGESPERYRIFGAARVGTTREFEGDFDDPAWLWNDWPTGPITRHPINQDLHLRTAVDFSELQPKGPYHFKPGLKTPGAESIAEDVEGWRNRLLTDAELRTDTLEQNGQSRQDARRVAEREIADAWAARGYPNHRFDYLLVWKYTGWFCHHIHEHSWAVNLGPANDAKDNLIYLAKEEHQRITDWFEGRKDAINSRLDILEGP
jgi:hypothetical protein